MNFIEENIKKHVHKPYDPHTGEGCNGERECLRIEDAPFPLLHLPKQMMAERVCKDLKKHKSIEKYFKANKEEFTREKFVEFWIRFCELRYSYDFEFWAITAATIQDKLTGNLIGFRLNGGQRLMLQSLEEMRVRRVPMRSINLKTRQIGGSTFYQMYGDWIQMILKKNWNSVIVAHVKDAAITIRGMFDVLINEMIPINGIKYQIQGYQNTQNIKIIKQRGCRITVGSAEVPDSVRSQDVKIAHFSEVAKYPNTSKKGTAKLIGSIVGTIPKIPDTLIVFESTANGVGDFFHEEWEKAVKGKSSYEPIFVPWYKIEMYSQEFDGRYLDHDGKTIDGPIEEFVATMTDYEKSNFHLHKALTLENLNWYRGKRSEMTSDEEMRQDFPYDELEAFQNSGMPDFNPAHINALRDGCSDPMYVGDIIALSSPAEARINKIKRKECLLDLRFEINEQATEGIKESNPKTKLRHELNKIKVWELPDEDMKVSDRYIVIYDPSKGVTDKADFGVICVMDRYWRMYGGSTSVIAEWRGHEDKDIAIWKAAQIAKFYCNALLIIENNTYDSQQRDDDTEFIYEVIADYYPNLYVRTSADKVREGAPIKYGFNTNKQTKPAIIANYVAVVREKKYIERNAEALNEALWYEKKKNGKHGARDGKHDDIIMTRMIGLWVDFELPLPVIIDNVPKVKKRKLVGESSL